jgi:hypothetical protein
MNTRQLWRLLVATALVVALGVVVHVAREKNRRTSGAGQGRLLLPSLAVNDVESVRILDGGGTLELRRKDTGWTVAQRDDYPADFGQIQALLQDLAALKATQVLRVGPAQLARLELAGAEDASRSAGGAEIRLAGANGTELTRLLIGKEYRKSSDQADPYGFGGFPVGRYVRVPATESVALVSKTLGNVRSSPADWLDKEFVRVSEVRMARLERNGGPLWRLERDSAAATLALADAPADKEVDGAKVREVGSALAWASFADVAGRLQDPPQLGLENAHIYTVADFAGFEYSLRIGPVTPEGRYPVTATVRYQAPAGPVAAEGETPEEQAKKNDDFARRQRENQDKATALARRLDGWVYLVERHTLERLLVDKEAFLRAPAAADKGEDDLNGDEGEDEEAATEAVAEPVP